MGLSVNRGGFRKEKQGRILGTRMGMSADGMLYNVRVIGRRRETTAVYVQKRNGRLDYCMYVCMGAILIR